MANNSGKNTQSGTPSELAFYLHDLKQLTEQLSNLAESMQRMSASGDGDSNDPALSYYSNP